MQLRTGVVSAILVVGAAIGAFAATRATFMLTNGQRVSGELVFHGGQANNMIDNQLNLGNNGKEQSYPLDSVAVIDVSGGTPSQDELSKALAAPQALALRSGAVQSGQFVNVRSGTTLIWRNDAGQEQSYGLGDVARVYLNTTSARSLFNYTAPAQTRAAASPAPTSTPAPSGRSRASGRSPAPGRSASGMYPASETPAASERLGRSGRRGNAIDVAANQPWTDTGIQVRAGDMITFRASGQIVIVPGAAPIGPAGTRGGRSANYPVPNMPAGSLIGRVGTSAPFAIGTGTAAVRMPADGVLQLGINDDVFTDNTGTFSIAVQTAGQGGRIR